MDFSLTADQELLRETARTLLAQRVPADAAARAHRRPRRGRAAVAPPARVRCARRRPTRPTCACSSSRSGYVAAPGPVLRVGRAVRARCSRRSASTALDAAVAGEIDRHRRGRRAPTGDWAPNDEPVKTFVLDADRVDVDRGRRRRARRCALDRRRRPCGRRRDASTRPAGCFDVAVDHGRIGAARAVDADGVDAVIDRATVALAAEMVGTARRLFDMALAVREGAQAVRRADRLVPGDPAQARRHGARPRARRRRAVHYAAMTDRRRRRRPHARRATSPRPRPAKRPSACAKDGIQIHGGIGYTWEHDLHLFIRARVRHPSTCSAPRGWHHDRLADLLF